MHIVHVALALIVGRRPFLPPGEQKFPILVEFRDTRAVVAVGDEHGAVRQPGDIGWTVEMRSVGAFYCLRSDGLYQLLPVMREFVDRMHVVIHHPNMLFGIVWIDGHEMRTLQDFVPLRPALDDIALRIDYDDAVFPIGIDAEFSIIEPHSIFRILSGSSRRRW